MTTIRAILDDEHIRAAAQRAADPTPNKALVTYADDRITGLQIRCQGKQAFWSLRYGKWTKVLGYVFPDAKRHVPSIGEARELAKATKEILDDDEQLLDPFFAKYYSIRETYGKKRIEAIRAARKEMRSKATTWSLRQCFEFVIEDRTRAGALKPIKKGYKEELELCVRRPQMKPLMDRPAADLTRGDFDIVRTALIQEAGISPANKVISNVRSVLDYCCSLQSKQSGLDHKDMWWQLLQGAGKVKSRTRTPTPDDVARTLALAEEYLRKPLPGRVDGKSGVRPNVFAGLVWLTLTAQRTFAALHLKHADFFEDPERGDGWYIASWEAGIMKSGKSHVIPVPPRAAQMMLPLIASAKTFGTSVWCFPSEKGTPDNDICVNASAPRQVLQRLAARDPLMREKNGTRKTVAVDLLSEQNIPWWSPHDLRRSLTSVMDKAGIPGGASAILAHEIKLSTELGEEHLTDEQRQRWREIRTAKITREAYGDPQFLSLKAPAMEAWTDAIIDAYEDINGVAARRKEALVNKRLKNFLRDFTMRSIRTQNESLKNIPAKIDRLDREIAGIERKIAIADGSDYLNGADIAIKQFFKRKLLAGDVASMVRAQDKDDFQRAVEQIQIEIPDFDPQQLAPEYDTLRAAFFNGDCDASRFKQEVTRLWGVEFFY
ncbi:MULTISPECIES: hypothetical protein [unclassified Shinella]|uniref:hypothetical protein n=1 Tax=unclassified Shinella TaxID=2643062 RepID=UPI00234E9289|nr:MULTISPECIES: hypothetical protein [unclassified Shinella]MCO5152842.1 hypothetical protein [Shinella sp.]MDC7260834.1 hypothetical protein [Shinella sp. HY16]MDC7267729.1 hypothetical protein [Shinella sp. YZ44]